MLIGVVFKACIVYSMCLPKKIMGEFSYAYCTIQLDLSKKGTLAFGNFLVSLFKFNLFLIALKEKQVNPIG